MASWHQASVQATRAGLGLLPAVVAALLASPPTTAQSPQAAATAHGPTVITVPTVITPPARTITQPAAGPSTTPGASGALGEPGAGSGPQAPVADEAGPRFAVPSSHDGAGRIAVPVKINGRGPYRFLLDTGANRSALTSRVATELGLTLSDKDAMLVQGVNGRVRARVAVVDRLELGDIVVGSQHLPVLDGEVFAGLDGSLGADLLANLRVTADFAHDVVSISADHPVPEPGHFGLVRAKKISGWLLQVSGHARGQRLEMVIDTGSSQTLGNRALYRSLTGYTLEQASALTVAVIDATQTAENGLTISVSPIVLGDLMIQNTHVTFGDFPVFGLWGLDYQPALLLGMDVLGSLRGLTIDYQRRELTALPRLQ